MIRAEISSSNPPGIKSVRWIDVWNGTKNGPRNYELTIFLLETYQVFINSNQYTDIGSTKLYQPDNFVRNL